MVGITLSLPCWAVKSNRVVFTIGSAWCEVNACTNFTVFVGIAAYTVTMCIVARVSIISSADGLGTVGSAQEVCLHGYADIFLDLMVLTGTITL